MDQDEIKGVAASMFAVAFLERNGCEWEAYFGEDEGFPYLALGFGNHKAGGELRVYGPDCARIGAMVFTGNTFCRECGSVDSAVLSVKFLIEGLPDFAAAVDPEWRCFGGEPTFEGFSKEALRISATTVINEALAQGTDGLGLPVHGEGAGLTMRP